jgi:hypothetical protein
VTVAARQKYRVQIEEGQAPWDYSFNDPFVLTTSIEPGGAFDYGFHTYYAMFASR